MNTRDVRLGKARLFETIYALGVSLFGAKCTNIKTVTRQCMLERRIINLRIVGERNEGRVVIDTKRGQCHIRPFCDDLHIGKSLDRGESSARIDNGHVITKQLPDGRQRLADMHRAGDYKPRRWHIDGKEKAPLRCLLHAALGHAQAFFQRVFQGDPSRHHQPSPAAARRSLHR